MFLVFFFFCVSDIWTGNFYVFVICMCVFRAEFCFGRYVFWLPLYDLLGFGASGF